MVMSPVVYIIIKLTYIVDFMLSLNSSMFGKTDIDAGPVGFIYTPGKIYSRVI